MYKIEGKDIIISGFENGIADSPYIGIGDMRNINNSSVPNEAAVAFQTVKSSLASVSGSVASANAGTDTITFSGLTGVLANYTAVIFTGASLPTGISAATVYYLGSVSGLTAKIYTRGDLNVGSLINITGTGTGTFASVDMGSPTYLKSYTFNSFSTDGLPVNTFIAVDYNGRVWAFNTVGSTWVYLGNTTLTHAYGNGLAFWQGFIFVWRATSLDYLPVDDIYDYSKWVYGWDPFDASSGKEISNYPNGTDAAVSHDTLIFTDDKFFSCDYSFLQSLSIKVGVTVDPTDATSYDYAKKALSLPSWDIAQCLSQNGTNFSLLIGGSFNYIYPWDISSPTFGSPILLAENFIKRMITVNTNTYIFAGIRGNIYVTNGSQAQVYKKVPDFLSGTEEPYFYWGGATFDRNNLYFGVQAYSNATVAIPNYGGLWKINLTTDSMTLLNELSYATYNGMATAMVLRPLQFLNAIPVGYALFIGWSSGASTYGIDAYDGNPYSSGQSYIDSDMIPIGTFLKPFTPSQVEWKVSVPLVAGESVAMYYRTNLTASYTLIPRTNTNTLVGAISDEMTTNFEKAQWVQLRAVLTSTNTTPTYTRLTEFRIRDYTP